MRDSLAQGAPLDSVAVSTVADSLGAPLHLPYSFGIVRQLVEEVVTVSDDALQDAMLTGFSRLKLAVEPAGAAALAALAGPLRERLRGKAVGLIVVRRQYRPGRVRRPSGGRPRAARIARGTGGMTTAPPEPDAPRGPGVRLYVEAPLAAGATVAPSAEQHHYLRNVMRTPAGAPVRLFNGRDGEWLATVEALGRKGAALAVTAQTRSQEPEPDLWLCFAPVKKARIDFVAQKASELGVSALQPVMTRYTQVARVNLERLRANAVEAAEQCARLSVPAVFPPRRLEDLIGDWPADRRILLLDETQTGIPIIDTLRRRGDARGRPLGRLRRAGGRLCAGGA